MIQSVEIKGNKTIVKSTDLDGNKYNDTLNAVSDSLRHALQNCAPIIKSCFSTDAEVFCTGVVYGTEEDLPAVCFIGTVYDNFLGKEYPVKTAKIILADEVRDEDKYVAEKSGGFAVNLRGEVVPKLNSFVLDQLNQLSITAENMANEVKRQMNLFEEQLNEQ